MSDQQASSTGQTVTEGTQTEGEFVPKRAYEEVSRDMHRYKQSAREAAAAKAEYEAKLKALEEEKLREKQEWKELYEREKQEAEVAKRKAREEREAYLTAVKKSALKNELGGRIKDVYLTHANIGSIEINEDGTINQESLLRVANDFRKNHGELIPPASTPEPTATAAPTGRTVATGEKTIDQMSYSEKIAALRNLKQ